MYENYNLRVAFTLNYLYYTLTYQLFSSIYFEDTKKCISQYYRAQTKNCYVLSTVQIPKHISSNDVKQRKAANINI